MLNNADEARVYLENTPRAWRYLLAVEYGYVPLGKAAAALAMEVGDFYLVQQAAGETCKALAKKPEAPAAPAAGT